MMTVDFLKNECVKLMNRYEDASGYLLSEYHANLEDEAWQAIDEKDAKKLARIHLRLSNLVDNLE